MEPQTTPAPKSWPVLSPHERRVLGVLVEKQKTTPDAYPLSLNGTITGCNQKSNRDPVTNLDEYEVEEALSAAQQKGLVMKVISGRVEKWRHLLYDVWHADKVEMAVLAELLLRGPQTEGELRGRASRMEPIADLESLRGILRSLGQRKLVVYLTPEGKRGTVVTHGFHAPEELGRLRTHHTAAFDASESAPPAPPRPVAQAASPPPAAPPPPDRIGPLEAKLAEAQAEIVRLREQVAALTEQVATVTSELRGIEQALGIEPTGDRTP
jgi:uncharacterized protein YceH (UPF0502 family)